MNTKAVFGAVILVLLTVCTCGSAPAGLGKAISKDAATTSTAAICASPTEYEGKTVVVRGKITRECPAGCWFWVQDQSGELYVNIKPSNLAIPQRVGRSITVLGTVALESGRPQLIGTGLEF